MRYVVGYPIVVVVVVVPSWSRFTTVHLSQFYTYICLNLLLVINFLFGAFRFECIGINSWSHWKGMNRCNGMDWLVSSLEHHDQILFPFFLICPLFLKLYRFVPLPFMSVLSSNMQVLLLVSFGGTPYHLICFIYWKNRYESDIAFM